jgi:transposase InsO family protein
MSWLERPPKTERHARWLIKLQDYNFTIKHIAGDNNVLADLMSRPPGLSKEDCSKLQLITRVSTEGTSEVVTLGPKIETLDRVDVIGAISRVGFNQEIQQAQSPEFLEKFRKDSLIKIDHIWYLKTKHGNRILVPPSFRERVLTFIHQLGHFGRKRTLQLVQATYTWPNMQSDVAKFVLTCEPCQINKKSRVAKRVWQKFPITSRFKTVHVDLVGPLQKSTKGRQYIFTMIDRYSRWMEAVPLANIRATDCAEAFFRVWVCRFGVPETVISDQGSQFESFVYNDMLKRLGAKHVRTTAYHPQSNGKVERSHSTIKNILRCLSAHRADWDKVLPTTMLAMRTAINDTGTSPALLVFGEHITLPSLIVTAERTYPEGNESDFIVKLRKDLKVLRQFVTELSDETQDGVKPDNHYPHKNVWVLDPLLKNCLSPKYSGPFKVLSSDQYPVLLLDINGNHKRVNVDRCKPAPRLCELPDYSWQKDDDGFHLPMEPQPSRFDQSDTVEGLIQIGDVPPAIRVAIPATEQTAHVPLGVPTGSNLGGSDPVISDGMIQSEINQTNELGNKVMVPSAEHDIFHSKQVDLNSKVNPLIVNQEPVRQTSLTVSQDSIIQPPLTVSQDSIIQPSLAVSQTPIRQSSVSLAQSNELMELHPLHYSSPIVQRRPPTDQLVQPQQDLTHETNLSEPSIVKASVVTEPLRTRYGRTVLPPKRYV